MKRHIFWTETKIAKLKALWFQGQTAQAIFEILEAPSRMSVVGKAHRLRLPTRRETCGRHSQPPTPVREMPKHTLGARSLLDLSPDECRFPVAKNIQMLFCGKPVVPGKPYCASCHRLTIKRDSKTKENKHVD